MNMKQKKIFAYIAAVMLFVTSFVYLPPVNKANAVSGFVTRSGSQLMLSGSPFRFSGANIYWLVLDENVGGVDYPTTFRVDDALDTVAEMGGTVVRSLVAADSVGCSKCIEPSLGTFNETTLTKLDYAVKSAGDRGIRLILPLVDNYSYIYDGWIGTYAGWRGLGSSSFYTDATVIGDFEQRISMLLNRVNTLTGVAYKNDPAILAWETGNELSPPVSWTQTIANYIKSIDTNHLVIDGSYGINSSALSLTNVDIYSDHFYPMDSSRLNSGANTVAAANKVYYAGEYGWSQDTGTALTSFLPAIESNTAISGDTYWSLFGHNDNYGYVQHDDGYTLHYPGDSADMRSRAQSLRNHAYAMRGISVPAHGTPKTPLITDITSSAVISWRGGTIADSYTVERSTAGSGGPWTVICNQCATDNSTPWSDSTAPNGAVWYRVKGHNLSGVAGSYSPVYQASISGGGSSTVNDNGAGITYTGSWAYSPNRGVGDYLDDVHYTTANSDFFQYTFTGTGIDYYAETGTDRGNVDIYIDGVFQQTVSCYSAATGVQQKVYSKTGLTSGSHTIKAVKTSGTYMTLDKFGVTTSGGGSVSVLNDNGAGITYTGSWVYSPNRGVGDYLDDVHYTTANSDFFQYTFTGTGIDYYAETSTDRGNVDIYIDGVFQQTVSCYSTATGVQQKVYSKIGLTSGSHTIKAVKTSGIYMTLDKLAVTTGGGSPTALNDNNAGITYTGSWVYSPNRGAGDYLDDLHYTTVNNDFFQYTFTGTGIDYITEKSTDRGNVDIYIDSVFQQTVNCNGAFAAQQTMYSTTGLASGSHTLKAVKTSGTYMGLDKLVTYQ